MRHRLAVKIVLVAGVLGAVGLLPSARAVIAATPTRSFSTDVSSHGGSLETPESHPPMATAGSADAITGPALFPSTSSGEITPTITEFSSGLNPGSYPYDIVVGPEGNLWFTDQGPPMGNPDFGKTPAIGRITPNGKITEFSAGLDAGSIPVNIVAGPEGNLWFTNQGNTPGVGRITPDGTITEFTSGLQEGDIPTQIVSGPDGNLWFTERGAVKAIGRITASGTITLFTSGLSSDSAPWFIVPGPEGNLWFSDAHAPAIGRITPSGTITEFSAGLNAGSVPYDIVLGPDGNLWFTDQGSTKAIGRTTPAGTITEISAGLNTGSYPSNIVAGPDDKLWFTDYLGSTPAIGEVRAGPLEATPPITEYSNGLDAGSRPWEIVTGADGDLWFTGRFPGGIGRITPGEELLMSRGLTEFSSGLNVESAPWSIVSGPDGNLWFTDNGGNGGTPAIGRITTPATIAQASATATGPSSVVVSGIVAGHSQPTSFHVDYYSGGSITCSYAECEWHGANITSSPEQSLGEASGDTPFSVTLTVPDLHPSAGVSSDLGRVIQVVATNPTGTTHDNVFPVSFPPGWPFSPTGGGGSGGGGSSSGSSGGVPRSTATQISPAQIATLLGEELVPSGKAAKIATLLRTSGLTVAFDALEAGTAVIDWYQVPPGARLAKTAKPSPTLVASGRMTFPAAGIARIKVKLTPTGKRLFKNADRLKLTARGTFTPAREASVVATKAFVIKR
jgi:streptogramin lyase